MSEPLALVEPKDDLSRRYYRLSEIAGMTGLSKSFLRSCIDEGLLKASRFKHSPKVWVVAAEDLDDFLARELVPVKAE